MSVGFDFDLGRELKKKIDLKDLFLLSWLPLVSIMVFFLPESVQSVLALNYQDPSLFSMFTAMFVHSGFKHLSLNLVFYSLFSLVSLCLFSLAERKRSFYRVFLLIVFVVPFLLSLLNLILIDARMGRGLSGIVASFIGLIPVSLYLFLKNRFDLNLTKLFSVSLFLLATSLISFSVVNSPLARVAYFLLINLMAVFLLWLSLKEINIKSLNSVIKDKTKQKFLLLVFSLFLIFLSGIFSLFPMSLTYNEGFVNILSHYFGLCLGFMISYIVLVLDL